MRKPPPQGNYSGPFDMYLDIETGPSPDCAEHCPVFEAPSNYKDPEKIAANIAEQLEKWKSRAALHPMTGEVLAIGYAMDEAEPEVLVGPEKELIANLFQMTREHLSKGRRVIGFNLIGFDLPFLGRRAWKHGIPVPKHFYTLWKSKWQWVDGFVDLMPMWDQGTYGKDGPKQGLGAIAKFLGLPGKSGNGADFAGLFYADKSAAIEYVKQDIRVTRAVAERLGV